MTFERQKAGQSFLGIEGGGTRTVALLADSAGRALRRLELGPANLRLLSDGQLIAQFRSVAAAMPFPDALGIGLSGAWAEADFERIRRAAGKAWPGVPCYATNDLETALMAVADQTDRGGRFPQVLIVSGTGSGTYGKGAGGKCLRVGGWGHVLGDGGSGYDIGLRALRAVVAHYDQGRAWPELGAQILQALALNEPDDLIGWAQAAGKAEIASLAVGVFRAWQRRDRLAAAILAEAASRLARDATTCARRLAPPGTPVRFIMTGSILLKQPRFAQQVGREVRRRWRKGVVASLKRETVWGAVELARKASEGRGARGGQSSPQPTVRSLRGASKQAEAGIRSAQPSPTEQRNPRSMNLDQLGVREAIALMLHEDATIPRRLLREARRIEQVVHAVARAWKRGGGLFYVGAGTSGRLGVLDASECPPTFSTPPDMVQGIIAGGQPALWSSVEGAEDDAGAGERAIEFRRVRGQDIVIGIAASGTTPFVWGALGEAKRRGATTVLICFNPYVTIPRRLQPAIVLAVNLGPEVLTGSTRLKAGTATKLLLNLITTLGMVRLGKVRSNLMIDLNPSNVKLQDRATRIVHDLTGADYPRAQAALERSGWVIKSAVARLSRRRSPPACPACPRETTTSRTAPGR